MPKLWVRRLDSLSARELAGTEGAQFPFWAPDSRELAYFAVGKLKRVDLSGGPPVIIADAEIGRGGTWNREGTILFSGDVTGGLRRVAAAGGKPAPVTTLDADRRESSHRWPVFLDGGRQFFYFALSPESRFNGIFLGSLDQPSQRTRLMDAASQASYIPARGGLPAYLVWSQQGALVAKPFDAKAGRFAGEAEPVTDGGAVFAQTGIFQTAHSTSDDGGILFGTGMAGNRLVWFNREGRAVGTVGETHSYGSVRISPDATRVLASIGTAAGSREISTLDLTRGVLTRLQSESMVVNAIWSPDSRRIDYYPVNGSVIFERSANGAGGEEILLQWPNLVWAVDRSPDGRYLLFDERGVGGRSNLWLLPLGNAEPGGRKPIPYLKTASNQMNGQFSPDGKWIAYASDESGSQQEIFVQSFPATDEMRWQVSIGGGSFPRWTRDGKELFYRALDGMLVTVPVRASGRGLAFGNPAHLFRLVEPLGTHSYVYDVAPDGRILAIAGAGDNTTALTVITNWRPEH
jgi:hypothetical protein